MSKQISIIIGFRFLFENIEQWTEFYEQITDTETDKKIINDTYWETKFDNFMYKNYRLFNNYTKFGYNVTRFDSDDYSDYIDTTIDTTIDVGIKIANIAVGKNENMCDFKKISEAFEQANNEEFINTIKNSILWKYCINKNGVMLLCQGNQLLCVSSKG